MAVKKKLKKKSSTSDNYEVTYIENVQEFFSEIKKFKSKNRKVLWFRGHCSNKYELKPSIYRKPFDPKEEEFLMSQFKARAIPYLDRVPAATSSNKDGYFEWLFLMQHYELPTRLLDWTTSALNALAFAVIFRDHEHTDIKGKGAHIWCIDPLKLNSKFTNISSIPNINENAEAQNTFDFVKAPGANVYDTPLAIYGPQNSKRIVGQKGVFTIFPANNNFVFDKTMPTGIGLKIIIRNDTLVKQIADELYTLGITESIIYPELDYVSTEIRREYIQQKVVKSKKKSKK